MAEYLIQSETLDDIADAINAKTGGSAAMTPAQMVTAIESISGGGGIQSASGEIVLASNEFQISVSGLSFKPNAFLVYGSTPAGRTTGAIKFVGYFMEWVNVYGNVNEISARNMSGVFSNLPSSLFDYDALPSSAYYTITNDGFTVSGANSSYIWPQGVSLYWKAWRFE